MLFPERTYPFNHSFLTEIYEKLFVQKGHNIVWTMYSFDPSNQKKSFNWNGTKVYLLSKLEEKKTIYGKILKRITLLRNTWLTLQAIRKEHIDIFQVRNSPYYGMVGILAKLLYGTIFVFQRSVMMEALKIEEYRLGLLKREKWRIAYLKYQSWLVDRCMHFADLVLPISETMKNELEARGVSKDKMLVIPLGINPEMECGVVQKEDLDLGKGPLVLYFGAVKRIRNLDFLLVAFQNVVSHVPEARLLILGVTHEDRDEVARLKAVASSLRIDDHVIWHETVPREMVNRYIAASDVCVSPIYPIYAYWFASPTKLVESMGMAKPVVVNDLPEQAKMIEASGGGICVQYDPKLFSEAIVFLLKNPENAKEMGKRARAYVLAHRSYQQMADELEERYYKLMCRKR
jgi:glycosyltransferase involved in cell wall biosynthesis